jgi:ElaB/YqjD/DUF883 family membrane-anchored ribosome-binding protein
MSQRKNPSEAELNATREALVADLKRLTEETQSVIQASAEEHFFDKAQSLRNALQNTLGNLSDGIHEGQEKIRQGVDTAEQRIRDQPLATVGAAALAGLVIGLLLNRGR